MNTTENNATQLLDRAKATLMAFSDRKLAISLGVHPTMICRAKKCATSMHPELLIALHEETGWSIKEMKETLASKKN